MELAPGSLRHLESPPAGWYFAGQARDVPHDSAHEVRLWGKGLVLFRSETGLAAVGGRCPHMGASLKKGTVRAGTLRCPFHAWEYGGDGVCRHVPGLEEPPEFARLPTWPLRERHGLLHLFRGSEPLYPLPFFTDEREEELVAARPFRMVVPCAWWMVGVNGFDTQHFANVHGRTPRDAPLVEHPSPYACRVIHRFRLTGDALQDRASRRLWGERAELSFTSWSGNTIVGTMRIGPFTSYLLVFTQPLGPQRCIADLVMFRPRRGDRLLARLVRPFELRVLRLITRAFFRHEVESLGQARLDPDRLVETDALLRGYLVWLVSLLAPGEESSVRHPAAVRA